MKKSRLTFAGLVGAVALAVPFAQATAGDEITRGQLMADTCINCHSAASAEAGGAPNLANYPSDLIVSQMKAFRDGDRPATVMDRHASGYTDEEIEALAAYFGQ